ncbi:MAG TPA: hypothetical protein PLU35_03230 [Phycisphaerales bacterium]|nr:hypothetical protein [Phycisphaerales bacterium]
MRQFTALTIIALLAGSLAGCGKSGTSSTGTQAPSTPPTWLLTAQPADALSVSDAKKQAAEGQTIVVRGRIGGRKSPISADSPVFVIVDLSLPHCGEDPDDKCPTPWDYCCEPKSDLAAQSATVQIVDAGGNTVPAIGGSLKPLDEVIVVGAVGARPTEGVLTIRATGVYRVGG